MTRYLFITVLIVTGCSSKVEVPTSLREALETRRQAAGLGSLDFAPEDALEVADEPKKKIEIANDKLKAGDFDAALAAATDALVAAHHVSEKERLFDGMLGTSVALEAVKMIDRTLATTGPSRESARKAKHDLQSIYFDSDYIYRVLVWESAFTAKTLADGEWRDAAEEAGELDEAEEEAQKWIVRLAVAEERAARIQALGARAIVEIEDVGRACAAIDDGAGCDIYATLAFRRVEVQTAVARLIKKL